MKLVTWNVNSLNVRAEHVAAFLDRVQPDILGLQELKLTDDRVPRAIFTDRGYHIESFGQKTYNGVLLATKQPMTEVHRGLEPADAGQSRLIAARVAGLWVVDVYVPQGSEVTSEKFPYKLSFLDALREWLAPRVAAGESVVLMGDINVAPMDDDVWSVEEMQDQVSFHPLEKERFAGLLSIGLVDPVKPRLPARSFTYWDYRDLAFRRKRGMRIDHILTTADVAARVSGARVEIEERKREKPSDHAPVVLELDGSAG